MLILKSINPSGLFSYSNTHKNIPLNQYQLVLIDGINKDLNNDSNGSGKTNFFESITQTLFLENTKKLTSTDVGNKCEDSYYKGELEFALDTIQYKVMNVKDRKETELYFYQSINDLRGASINKGEHSTLNKIIKTININYDQFKATCYITQDRTDNFIYGDSAVQMDVITNILNLSIWDTVHDKTKELIKAIETSFNNLKQELILKQALLNAIPKHNLTELSEALNKSKIQIQTLTEKVKEENEIKNKYLFNRQAIETEINKIKNKQIATELEHNSNITIQNNKIELLQKQINRNNDAAIYYKDQLKNKDALLVKLDSIDLQAVKLLNCKDVTETRNTIYDTYLKASSEIISLNREITHIKDILSKIQKGEGICDYCGASRTEQELSEYANSLTNQLQIVIKNRGSQTDLLDLYQVQLKEIEDKLKDYNNAQKQLISLNKQKLEIETSIAKLDTLVSVIETLTEETNRLIIEIDNIKSNISNITSLYVNIKNQLIAEVEKQTTILETIPVYDETILTNLTESYILLMKELAGIEEQIKQAEVAEKQKQEYQTWINNNTLLLNSYETDLKYKAWLKDAFSDTGIKSYKFESVIERLNQKLSEYSQILTGGEIITWCSSLKELKSKELRRKFSIYVQERNKKGIPLSAYSGGEKALISLMYTGGLWEVATEGLDRSCNVLFLDEVFSSLSKNNRIITANLLEHWKKSWRNIYVITHTDLSDCIDFDAVYYVEKIKGISNMWVKA